MTEPAVIDLRSDTVTRPTPAMREAMATCEVGDDVFGDDPTVIKLENVTAEMVGMEAALWCPTGTMANQVAIATHTHPGQEVVAGYGSHIVNYEVGAISWNSLCQLRAFPDDDGRPDPDAVEAALRSESLHSPGTGLLCLENTHNWRGGRVLPFDTLKTCSRAARERGIPVHLDGARIWNAAAASGTPVPDHAGEVDSLMFCLSKGLASPAGSMLCGKRDFIDRARRLRKRFGGGLRQAGVLAACGLISLERMIDRLGEDHINAGNLASAVAAAGLLDIDLETVETNICIFTPPSDAPWSNTEFAKAAREEGLLVTHMAGNLVRMVTHNDFAPEWIEPVIERARRAVERIS